MDRKSNVSSHQWPVVIDSVHCLAEAERRIVEIRNAFRFVQFKTEMLRELLFDIHVTSEWNIRETLLLFHRLIVLFPTQYFSIFHFCLFLSNRRMKRLMYISWMLASIFISLLAFIPKPRSKSTWQQSHWSYRFEPIADYCICKSVCMTSQRKLLQMTYDFQMTITMLTPNSIYHVVTLHFQVNAITFSWEMKLTRSFFRNARFFFSKLPIFAKFSKKNTKMLAMFHY